MGNVPPPNAEGASTTGLMIFKGAFARDVVEYQPTYELPFTVGTGCVGRRRRDRVPRRLQSARPATASTDLAVPTRRRRRRGGRPAGRR